MQELRVELAAFLTALLTGMTVACAYVCIRVLRRVFRHSLALIAVEDMIYWLGMAVYVFVQIYDTSSGSIRWYFLIGMLAGLLIFLFSGKILGRIRAGWHEKRKKNS